MIVSQTVCWKNTSGEYVLQFDGIYTEIVDIYSDVISLRSRTFSYFSIIWKKRNIVLIDYWLLLFSDIYNGSTSMFVDKQCFFRITIYFLSSKLYSEFIISISFIREHFWKNQLIDKYICNSYLDFHACWRRILLFLDLVLILL